jgi:hypothetical protein
METLVSASGDYAAALRFVVSVLMTEGLGP